MSGGDKGRNAAANAQWGGRFSAGPDVVMAEINASIGFDQRLWRQDIRGSLAHAAMLARAGLLSAADEAAIRDGLAAIGDEITAGRFAWSTELEDIHMNIEARLTERVGEAGKRLHTARSRNDQVATDYRLWVRDAIDGLDGQMAELMRALATRAAEHAADPMPGFTHLQTAQPVTFGHHLLAYVEMLHRDRGRMADAKAPAERVPARLGGAGRHVLPDRPRHDRGGAGLRPPHRQLAGRRVRPGLRARVPGRGGDLRGAPVAPGGGDRAMVFRPVRLRAAVGRLDTPGRPSCRKSAIQTPPSWPAARPGGWWGRW